MIIEKIRKLSKEEMEQKISSLKEELFNAKIELNLVKLKDTSRIRKIKRLIKQIKTIMREKEIVQLHNIDENIKLQNDSVLDLVHDSHTETENSVENKDISLDKKENSS